MKFLVNDKKIDTAEKIQLVLSYLLQLSLIMAILFFLLKENWLNAFLTSGIFILTLLPSLLRRNYKMHLPIEIDLAAILLIYTSLFLGEVNSYYQKLWWWDLLLHAGSGILLGIVGFLVLYILTREEKIHLRLSPGFSALFSGTFSLAVGVLWEIFEFCMDTLFGLNMQKSGIADTMTDLIVYTLGTFLVVGLGYWYGKKERRLINKLISAFLNRGQLVH